MNEELQQRLRAVSRQPGHITPEDMDTSVNSQGHRSRIGRFTASTAHMLRQGRENPMRVAVPAYYGDTTNGTADDSETFTLPQSIVDAPVTQSAVVWIGSEYYGSPDAIDYDADEITVSDPGTNNTLHVYYITDRAATLEIRKSVPQSSSDGSQRVYNENLGLVHGTPQQEQPEFLSLGQTPLQGWVGTDMTLDVYVDAPYTIRWTDPDGDGTEPTNALLNIPAMVGSAEVAGLTSTVKQDMGRA